MQGNPNLINIGIDCIIATIGLTIVISYSKNNKEPCVSCNTRKKETVHHQASAKQKTLLNVEINKNQDIRFFFEELVVKTILLISASDDNFDYRESTYLKQWVKTLLSYYPENSRNQVIERINSYIKKYIRLSYKGISILHNDLKYFKNLGNNKLSFELIEVCLDAILADHVIKDGELKMLNEVAESLDISKTKFTKLKTKSLSISKLNNTSDENIKALIGITIDMSKEDILKHLKCEFKRWNQVAGHKDPEKREQAEEMLHHLANLRKNYS
jgi:uncharacterized tellurite resistance protein B-like protein